MSIALVIITVIVIHKPDILLITVATAFIIFWCLVADIVLLMVAMFGNREAFRSDAPLPAVS